MFLRTRLKFKLVKKKVSAKLVGMECYYAPAESSNWGKWGQYKISNWWNGITHFLRVKIGWNAVGIALAADGMLLRTHWKFPSVNTRSVVN